MTSPTPEPSSTPILGIDLGTTRSVVSYLDDHGRPQTILNADGDMTTPSAVAFEDGDVLIGKEAIKSLAITPDQVVQFAKREMGNDGHMISIDGYDYPAELIQSFILGRLRRDAERHFGDTAQSVVITVPAFFNEPKRRATMDAGLLAGFSVEAIINEPTAAALAYGIEHGFMDPDGVFKKPETLLVYDLGGGTFDVCILRIEGDAINVLGIDGNARLGGLDWDACIVDWLIDEFENNCDIDRKKLEANKGILQREAEEIKHSLTARKQTNVKIRLGDAVLQTQLTRSLFDELTAHLLDRTRFTIKKALEAAKLTWSGIDRVLLVGGATRMPQIVEMLQRETDITIDQSVSPDQAVALGAAVYANILSQRANGGESSGKQPLRSVDVTDVNAHHLGVLGVELSTGRPQGQVIIPKNSPLPAMNVARFKTVKPNQRSVVVKVIEGGDMRGHNATTIGTFSVRDLPAGLPAGSPVEVILQYNVDGIIQAEAIVLATGKKNRIEIKRDAGLTETEIDEWQDISSEIYEALGLD
ncbi:Chaperone protein DnaK [Planctomycetes bacterium CA13]|uniref:Chaperone protein DnaK n=1 Tax=Novipirellula herctigrandis TaxID=2527986 RepID=A0A5C5YVG9_9BACT|nr:Chaperone protein DnaK [Planctomycetes bacterium CA13]